MRFIAFIFTILIPLLATAQVGIGNNSPDTSSILDISSIETGVLIPRMTTSQRNMINNPANGLLIYNTDSDQFQYNSNSNITPIWQALDSSPSSTSNIGQSVKYSNTDTTTDVNLATAISAPLLGTLEWNDNTTLYTANTSTHEITINETGRYKVIINIPLNTLGTTARMSPEIRIVIQGTEVGTFSSTGYMRNNNTNQKSSLHITEVLEITSGQSVSVNIIAGGTVNNSVANDVTIRAAGSASIYIEKLM